MGTQQFLPQARTDQLVVHTLPDETLVYDLTRHTAHCLNRTSAMVWERCDGQTTVGEMASRLYKNLNAPVSEDVVWLALEQLETVHLLEEQASQPVAGTRISRREMVRQLGLGAAFVVPAILSIVAPEAVEAATTCTGIGVTCTTNSQCCINNVGRRCCHESQHICKNGFGDCIGS